MPQGVCTICGQWQDDLGACARCGQMIGLCCWSFKDECCVQCKVDQDIDNGNDAA